MKRRAVALIAYARYGYFARVLSSLLDQRIGAETLFDRFDVHLFQDGLWERETAANRQGHAQIGAAIEALEDRVTVHRQSENLGVARHFDYVERVLFEQRDYEVGHFFEDDLVLAPGYMQVMELLADRFLDDPRVGMFSAHPGDCTRSLKQQREKRDQYSSIDHNWGFGLTRAFWKRRQSFVDLYLKWCNSFLYRERPSAEILEWLKTAGFQPRASSQDFAKTCATVALGAVKLATTPNFGLPIGEEGLHSRPEIFKRLGLDRAVLFTDELAAVPELDDTQFHDLFRDQAKAVLKEPGSFDHTDWINRLQQGEFDPISQVEEAKKRRAPVGSANEQDIAACYRVFLGRNAENENVIRSRAGRPMAEVLTSFLESNEFSSARSGLAPVFSRVTSRLTDTWLENLEREHADGQTASGGGSDKSMVLPDVPAMEPAGLKTFEDALVGAACYLEFGCGESTTLAARSAVRTVYSVDTSAVLAKATRQALANSESKIRIEHCDVGIVGAWGRPIDRTRMPDYYRYAILPWQAAREDGKVPTLILIQGRFRVACFLYSLLTARPGARILFDNYADRTQYHPVERYCAVDELRGRMAMFTAHRQFSTADLCADLARFSVIPD